MGSVQIELVSRFNTAGLCVYEVETQSIRHNFLDLERHQTRITNSRYWKVPLGLKALLRPVSCTSACLEVIIGTATFSHLCNVLLWRPSTMSTLPSIRVVTLARKCVALGALGTRSFLWALATPSCGLTLPFSCR